MNKAKTELMTVNVNNSSQVCIPLTRQNMVMAQFDKFEIPILIDTGATLTMVSSKLLYAMNPKIMSLIIPTRLEAATTASGEDIKITGQIRLHFRLHDMSFDHTFYVLNDVTYWAVLGTDFLTSHQCKIDYDSHSLTVNSKVPQLMSLQILDRPSLGVLDCQNYLRPRVHGFKSESDRTNSIGYRCRDVYDTVTVDMEADETVPKDSHDLAYYSKVVPPPFTKKPPPAAPLPLDLTGTILPQAHQDQLKKLVCEYRDVFAANDTELGRTHVYQHHLRLKPGAQPPKERLYRTNAVERKFIEGQIREMLTNDIIENTTSQYSSPIVLVKKKDGSMRFCSDLRRINEIIEEDTYPLPLIQDVLDAIGQSRSSIYSILDLRAAFWQVPIHPDSRKYLTINSHVGKFCYKVLPFGLHSSPAAFQRLMNTVLKGVAWEFAIAFIDDVVVFSPDPETHLKHLTQIFDRLREAGLRLKPQKCVFGVDKIHYLGHVIDRTGIRPDEKKVKAVKDFETPTSLTKVKSFLGMVNYYRKFISDFAKIAKPLNELTRKTTGPFIWTTEAQEAFLELKRKLMSSPILVHADCSLPFKLTTDSSRTSLGWVLEQNQEGKNRVVCYGGKTLNQAQASYPISDLEALAVMSAIKDLDCYLRYAKFVVVTDHQPLKYMLKNPNPPPGRWSKWIAILSQYDFEVEYLKGSANRVADALSRVPHSDIASEDDDLDTYLCAVQGQPVSFPNGHIVDSIYVPSDRLNPIGLAAIRRGPRHKFFRTRNRVIHSAPSTKIIISREDPSLITSEAVINFCTPDLKPVGPASKSIQLMAGPNYKKLIQQSLNKNGRIPLGHLRKLKGAATASAWVYNFNAPKYKIDIKQTPTLLYKYLTQALHQLKGEGIERVIIPPNDLVSLGYPLTKALQVTSQAIWDYCQTDQPYVQEIFIPVQTQAVAEKLNTMFAKWTKTPTLKVFTPVAQPAPVRVSAKLSRPDKVVTDHQQLIKDVNIHPDYSNMDFEITPQELIKLQMEDPHFKPIMTFLKTGEYPSDLKQAKHLRKEVQNFELIAGILYKFHILPGVSSYENRARFLLCIPYPLRHRLLYAYHEAPISAHRTIAKMYAVMRLSYYWKTMLADIQNWTQSCVKCSKVTKLPRHRRAKLEPMMECRPWQQLHVDLISPAQLNKYQYTCILTMIDKASKYCFAVPLHDGQAVTIAKAIFSEVISKFGMVDTIVSDRGADFVSPILGELCTILGTKRNFTSSYHPMSNGQCENFNKVFKEHLLRQVGDHPDQWPEYVDSTLYALRNTVSKATGVTPHQYLFGQEPKLLFDIKVDDKFTHPSLTVRQYLSQLRTKMKFIRDQAKTVMEDQQKKMTDYYDKHSKPYNYEIGDRVWITSPEPQQGSTKKFKSKYIGPFILIAKTSQNTFKVQREGTDKVSDVAIHCNRFKPCITRYIKPPDKTQEIDESQVGPQLPLTVCNDSDMEDTVQDKKDQDKQADNGRTTDECDGLSGDISKPTGDAQSKVKPGAADRSDLVDRIDQIVQQVGQWNDQVTPPDPTPPTSVEDAIYLVKRIIRGKWTPHGPKYLVHWQGYPASQATWEPWENLSSPVQEDLKTHPVRMFGRKPEGMHYDTPSGSVGIKLINTSPDPLYKDMTEAEREEAYAADTESDSSDEEPKFYLDPAMEID